MSVRRFTALFVVLLASPAVAEPADADKAKQMLARVVTAVQQDQTAAMAKFSAGADGFRDGTIYPFCFRLSDGIVLTGQTAGSDIRSFPAVGQRLFEAGSRQDGDISEISYMAMKPPPADPSPVKKVSLVRRIGDVACGVGYP